MAQSGQDELQTLKERMKQQDKMASLGILSAGITHEIQNPLNFVINFSKMSQKMLDDFEDIMQTPINELTEDDRNDLVDIANDLRENMKKIEEHGERAISIIRGILLYSRGKEDERIPSDIAQLVHEYVWLAYHAMRSSDKTFNVSIHEEYQEGIAKMNVIPQDLSRAVLNVMNNACYAVAQRAATSASEYKPTIDVSLTQNGEDFTITITDNGIGMNEEVKQKMFDAFFTTKPAGKGTGLGMGIVKQIIEEKHHGRIEFDSVENDHTTFKFIIPVKQ